MYCEDPDIIRRTAKLGLIVAAVVVCLMLIREII